MKQVALFDIDQTLHDGFSGLHVLARDVKEKLISSDVLVKGQAALESYQKGKKSYEDAAREFLDIYATGLEGVRVNPIFESSSYYVEQTSKIMPELEEVIELLSESCEITLVTGEPQFIAEPFVHRLNADTCCSTEFGIDRGIFTGKVDAYLASRQEKTKAIDRFIKEGYREALFAFGDSEADYEMLSLAKHAICINATDGLKELAQKQGWHITTRHEVVALVTSLMR